MAANYWIAQTAEIALSSSGSFTTLIQVVAPTNIKERILGWGIYFDSTTEGPKVEVEVVLQSTAGTMSSLTPKKLNADNAETLQLTAQHTATAEPTAGDTLDVVEGSYEVRYPLGQEILLAGGGRLGIRAKASGTVNCRVKLIGEE